ncbi:MAG: RICIN domain-containing protein [Tenuifilaceae bacterium]|nr:RICIN domain-containing protein [Tenuifilaceae bacterium]
MKKYLAFAFTLLVIGSSVVSAQPQSSVMPTGKRFIIQSAMNYGRNPGGCWDIPGSPGAIGKGLNIQVWNIDGGVDRFFTLTDSPEGGYYEMFIGNTRNSRVDIAGGKSNNGTNVHTWERNNGTAQRFLFHHLGNGRFKIYDRNGKILCLADRKNDNGTNVHIWDDHDGISVEWYLLDANTRKAFIPSRTQQLAEAQLKGDAVPEGMNFRIQSAMSYGRSQEGFWDLSGKGQDAVKKGASIKIWNIDNGVDREYRFEKKRDSEYYQIYVGRTSNGVVDLSGGKTSNGTNVQVWEVNNGSAQDFYLKHLGDGRYKIYHRSGSIINLKNSNNSNGNNVHLWSDHNAIHCEWYLIDPATGKAYIPSQRQNTPEQRPSQRQSASGKRPSQRTSHKR